MVWVIIIIAFEFLKLGIHLAKHGEEYRDRYNFFIQFLITGITLFIFYKAGLFNVFKICG